MNVIKLNAIDSTNNYLKDLCSRSTLEDYTIVMADSQTKGRGQVGTVWQSESSKNLTASVFKEVSSLKIKHNFFISMVTALAISKALNKLNIPRIKIKWPNDILADGFKISGILIENIIKNNKINSAVLGIGINVNQKYFKDLPLASSMHLLTGRVYNIDEVLFTIINELQCYFDKLNNSELGSIKSEYESQLFRLHKPSTFQLNNKDHFTGYINGINTQGKLEILLEDAVIKTFDFKEIKLLY